MVWRCGTSIWHCHAASFGLATAVRIRGLVRPKFSQCTHRAGVGIQVRITWRAPDAGSSRDSLANMQLYANASYYYPPPSTRKCPKCTHMHGRSLMQLIHGCLQVPNKNVREFRCQPYGKIVQNLPHHAHATAIASRASSLRRCIPTYINSRQCSTHRYRDRGLDNYESRQNSRPRIGTLHGCRRTLSLSRVGHKRAIMTNGDESLISVA